MHFKRQADQFLLNPSSFHLALLLFSPLHLLACCTSINHSAEPIGKEQGSWLKHRRQEGRSGRKSLPISEMELRVEHRTTRTKNGKPIDATMGHIVCYRSILIRMETCIEATKECTWLEKTINSKEKSKRFLWVENK